MKKKNRIHLTLRVEEETLIEIKKIRRKLKIKSLGVTVDEIILEHKNTKIENGMFFNRIRLLEFQLSQKK